MSSTPNYLSASDAQWGMSPTAANTAVDGTGTSSLVYTATADGFIRAILIRPSGSNVATVVRAFLNLGGANSPSTPSNNTLIGECGMPVNTLSQTTTSQPNAIMLGPDGQGIPVKAGQRVYITIGTAVVNAFHIYVDAMVA